MPDILLKAVLPQLPYLVGAFSILVLFKLLRSPAVKGRWGEFVVIRLGLRRLDHMLYRDFGDIYLPRPDGNGSTQIDHVVVSRFGVFVIETKNIRGWIFGSEKQAQWTQQIYRKKSRFQNPLHQNALHVRALGHFLGLPLDRFHSLVFFIGDCEFKTPMPGNVLDAGLIPWIQNRTTRLLSDQQVEDILEKLESSVRSTDKRQAKRSHLLQLASRK